MSFSQSTTDIQLNGSTLCAQGQTAEDESLWRSSELDLDTCIGNIDGTFAWGESNFSQSATDIELDGTILRAKLQKADGEEWEDAEIDLDEHISNIDGQLTYQP